MPPQLPNRALLQGHCVPGEPAGASPRLPENSSTCEYGGIAAAPIAGLLPLQDTQ